METIQELKKAETTNTTTITGDPKCITFTLNAYEFYELMAELESFHNIVNRDRSRLERIMSRLASQCGIKLEFAKPKHSFGDPVPENVLPKKRSWFSR